MGAHELVLDRDVRDWVFIPLTLFIVLVKLVTQYVHAVGTVCWPRTPSPVHAAGNSTHSQPRHNHQQYLEHRSTPAAAAAGAPSRVLRVQSPRHGSAVSAAAAWGPSHPRCCLGCGPGIHPQQQ
jgi:hypothetical protein